MKVSKPFILNIPVMLDKKLQDYLHDNPPDFTYNMIYFYYLIHLLAYKHSAKKKKKFTSLNIKYLKSITGYNIDRYIKILLNGEFISDGFFNEKDKKKYGYRLNDVYIGKLIQVEIKPGTKLFKKQIKRQNIKKSHYVRLEPHLKQMKDLFRSIEFDYDLAEQYLINTDNGSSYHSFVALQRIKDKRFRNFHRNKTNNRLDTNLTTLLSELLQFMIGDWVSIDLKNSQPFFLGFNILKLITEIEINSTTNIRYLLQYLIKQKNEFSELVKVFGIKPVKRILKIRQNAKKGDLANLSMFNDSVLNGTIYDDFTILFDGQLTRDEAKDTFLKVMYSPNVIYDNYRRIVPYLKVKNQFKKVYPVIYQILEILKEKDNSLLANYLTKYESQIFIDKICKELVECGIVPLTKHDSIIVKREYKTEALNIIRSVFMSEFGVVPTFHIEPLKKYNEINKKASQTIFR